MKKGKLVGITLLLLIVLGQIALGDGELLIRTQTNPYTEESIILATSVDPSISSTDEHGVHFILDILPCSFLISPNIDGFKVENEEGWVWESEEIEGYGSWIPNIRAGIGLNTPAANYDITGGGGYLWNAAFSSPFFLGDFAARFKLGDKFTLGPHIGVVHFNSPEWQEDADIDFSDARGFMAGVALTVGKENVSFSLAVDYVSASFDVETSEDGDWVANDDELDISGLGVQLGVILRF